MKKICFVFVSILFTSLILSAQGRNTRIFTVFTSYGCGCTGSGGAPETFTSNDQVLSDLPASGDHLGVFLASVNGACHEDVIDLLAGFEARRAFTASREIVEAVQDSGRVKDAAEMGLEPASIDSPLLAV